MITTYGIKKRHSFQHPTLLQLLFTITLTLFFCSFPQPSLGAAVRHAIIHKDLGDVDDSVDGTPVVRLPQTVVNTFYAYVDSGRVIVEWETASEVNIIGFRIKRLNPKTGKFRSISKQLPALLVSPEGGTYRYIDKRAKPGQKLTYKLIAISNDGDSQPFGPYTIQVEDPELGDLLAKDTAFDTVEVDGQHFNRKMKRRIKKEKIRSNRKRKFKKEKTVAGAYIYIKKNGICRLSVNQIASAMNKPLNKIKKWLKRNTLSITYQGQPVAWKRSADGNGLIFYGEDIDSLYTETNAYRITKGKGKIIESQDTAMPSDGPVAESFTATTYAEKDQWALTALFDDPYADYWCWDYLMAAYANLASKDFIVPAPGLVADTVGALTVEVKGGSTATHKVVVAVNGTPVGETTFVNKANHRHQFTVPAGVLINGDNKVTMTAVRPATGSSIIYVDRLDLSYEKAYQAINDQLFFNSEKSGVIRVSGFKKNDITIYDITDPGKIIEITSAVIDPSDESGFEIQFVTDDAKRQYLAVTGHTIMSLEDTQITGYLAPQLMNTRHTVDYLIITHHIFKEEIQRLADYRRSKGLSVQIVELQDIYDEFNYGIANPEAVRDFLEYAWHNWEKAPRYVVRVGDGSHDYKDVQLTGDTLMPPYMVPTPWGLSASENRLADVDGSDDGLPEMVVGLLPAKDNKVLAAMIDKIIDYEALRGDWKKTVLMVADNPDGGGNYPADSDALKALVSDPYITESIYLSNLGIVKTRDKLSTALDTGAFIMNYRGHATMERLAGEGILTKADVESLSNEGGLPILLTMACMAGRFEIPGYDAIGEAMVVKPESGAVAAWVSTGNSINALAKILDEEFFKAIFIDNEMVLGDAIHAALRAYKIRHPVDHTFMLDIYTLIGDPALIIR